MLYQFMKKKFIYQKSKKVFVAMSGGVDSSVAAALLKEQNYDITGVFFRLAPDYKEQENAARAVAEKLKIPFLVWDWRKEFKKEIINYFVAEYAANKTPNPCVACNKIFKFKKFLREAKKTGADFIATGHYAKITAKNDILHLAEAEDKNKDQSYFLYNLNQEILRKTFFPLEKCAKEEVRKMADNRHLPYLKNESHDICFLKNGQNDFLKKYIKTKKGKVITDEGKDAGEHEGAMFYTIGQRHGFGSGGGIPYYIVAKDIKKNLLVVANKAREEKFYMKTAEIKNTNWITEIPKTGKLYKARIRYRQPLQNCRIIELNKNFAKISFTKPQRALTPGQSLVLYDNRGKVLGGGIIFLEIYL